MDIDRYLMLRTGSPFWQLRVPVPRPLHASYGKKEVNRSLKTTDRREAARRALPLIVKLQAEWDELTSGMAALPASRRPTVEEMEAIATEWGYDRNLDFLAGARAKLKGATLPEWRHYLELRRSRLELRQHQVATGDVSGVSDSASKIIRRLGWQLRETDVGFHEFCSLLARTSLAAFSLAQKHAEGTLDATTDDPLVRKVKDRVNSQAPTGESILELFEHYADQKVISGDKRRAGVDQDRMVLRLFAGFVGTSRSVRSITIDEARDFRNTLDLLPPNFLKRSAYKGLSMREGAEKARREGEAQLSPITVARYVSTVSPFFDWLRSEGYTSHQPFTGLHRNPKKGKNPRPPYSTEQLNTILRSPVFTGYLVDGKEHLPGELRTSDWRYWIPLICLFTGARVGEIAQLRLQDVLEEHGHWFIYLRSDEGAQQQIKNGHTRPIAVHSMLRKLGFLAFVAAQRAARPDAREQLFPQLAAGKRQQFGDLPSDWWRDYLAKIKVKSGGDGMGMHSFRHTITDQLRLGRQRDSDIALVLGHSNRTVTTGYGRLREGDALTLYELIETARFEGVDFSHLGS